MKKRLFFALCVFLALACMCAMVSCGLADAGIDIGGDILYSKQPCPIEAIDDYSGLVSEGRLYYHGTGVLLLKSNGSLMWLYERAGVDLLCHFATGDYVRVAHGEVMESYPEQTYITRMALIENGSSSSITDEEWERLAQVITDIQTE